MIRFEMVFINEMKLVIGDSIMKKIFLFCFLQGLIVFPALAQDLTRQNWYFGSSQSAINFNISDNNPTLITDQNPAIGRGGTAVATNQNSGDLLFYTDGTQIFDARHNVMANGNGLNGNSNFNQAAAISPRPGPGNESQYYVFSNNGAIFYHLVDMSQSGNASAPEPDLGAVMSKNLSDPDIPATTEAMLVFKSGGSPYRYWLLVQEAGTDNIHLLEILGSDIVPRDILALPVTIAAAHFAGHAGSGRIAIAPQNSGTNIQIISFNAGGTLSYDRELLNSGFNDSAGQSVYDMEWSPDGTKMFISRYGDAGQPGMLYRYDLGLAGAGPDQVNPQSLYRSFGLQIGPDGALYHLYQETNGGPIRVGRITNPNDTLLTAINYETTPLGTNNFNAFQFPSFSPVRQITFASSGLSVIGTCYGTPTKFYVDTDPPADSYQWDFGDLFDPNPAPGYKAPIHEYSQPGTYEVTLVVTTDGTVDTIRQMINIVQTDTVDLGQDTVICPGETLTMDAGDNGLTYLWNTGETGQTIDVDSAGYYWVIVDNGTCTSYDGRNVEVYGEQMRVANVWYFGDNAGIDFNEMPPLALTDGQTHAPAGVASISDRNGKSLFYTDGNTIFDRNHNLMFDGNSIGGDILSTQSSLIIPFPNDETMFYVFTTKDIWNATGDHQYILSFSVVDIKEIGNGSVGEVVAKEVPLFTKSTERIAAIETGSGYWLLAHDFGNNTFRAYPITESGIGPPVLSSIGAVHSMGSKEYGEGHMKFSPDGSRVAVALATPSGNYVELFDFDVSTGTLSNYIQVELNEPFANYHVYGVEFASNSDKVFVTLNNQGSPQSRLYELKIHNFNKDSIETNMVQIADQSGVNFGALQTGPDGQIYIAMDGQGFVGNFQPALDTLQNSSFDYMNNRFDLSGGVSRLGLPNFVQNFTNQPSAPSASVTGGCIGQPSLFMGAGTSQIDEYLWLFGDGGSDSNPVTEHTYVKDSTYNVTFRVTNRCGLDTALLNAVTISGNPDEPTFDPVGLICDTNLVIDADDTNTPDLRFLWNTGDTTKTLTVTQPADYSVTIINAAGCTSDDTIQVFDGRPQLDLGPNIVVCQNDSVGLNTGVPAGSPPNQYNWTVNGAPMGVNDYFISVNTGAPGVFQYNVRVTDGLTGCIGEDSVTITVNSIPTAVYAVTNSTCGNNDGSIIITSPVTDITADWSNAAGTPFGTGSSLNNVIADVYNLDLRHNVSGCTNVYSIPVVDSDVSFTMSTTVTPDCLGGSIVVTTDVVNFVNASYTLVNEGTSESTTAPFGTAVFTIPSVISGTYTLQLTAGGCDNAAAGIVVTPLPVVDLSISPLFDLCSDDATVTAFSTTPGATFDWAGPNGFTAINTNPIIAPESGTYTVVASAPAVCDSTASAVVTVSNSPVVVIVPVSDGCADTREIRADVTGGSGNYSYSWAPTGDVGEVISIANSGTYIVTVRDQASTCEATATADVEVYNPISVLLTVNEQPCDNGNPVTLSTALNPIQPVTYSWYLDNQLLAGETLDSLETTAQGTFLVMVTTGHCDASDEINIVRAPSSPRFLDPSHTICPEPPVNEVVSVEIPQEYTFYRVWLLKTAEEIYEVSPRVFELTKEGNYLFRMVNALGCWTDDSTYVNNQCIPTVYAPNAFSPEASLVENQKFRVFPTFVDQFEIFIYNRWGELIFFSDDLNFMENDGWDGRKNGELLQGGTYTYVMRFTSTISPELGKIEQSGGIYLLR